MTRTTSKAAITDVKRKFANEWALKNPHSTIEKLRAAVRTEFGASLGTGDLVQIRDNAKAVHAQEIQKKFADGDGTEPRTDGGATSKQGSLTQLTGLVEQMRGAGIAKLEVNPDGTFTVAMRD